MAGRWLAGAAVAAALVLLGGCTSGSAGDPEPAATTPPPTPAEQLEQSAVAMESVQTAHFTIEVTGDLPDLPLNRAEGELTAAGDAQGTATIRQFGQLIEVEFVLVGGELYLKAATGGFASVPAALAQNVYDPSVILDPERGVAAVLRGVTSPTDAGAEGDIRRISGTVPQAVAAGVVPGITTDVEGMLGIDTTTDRLVDATFTLEGADGQPATVAVTLSELDAPVTISPPG
jgi:lipoprotein LprG